MLRWLLFLLCGVSLSLRAAVPIVDLPKVSDDQYDLSWDLTPIAASAAPLALTFTTAHGLGYRLQLDQLQARWLTLGDNAPAPTSTTLTLAPKHTYHFSLKRRSETMALLLDHHFLFSAPAPNLGGEQIAFSNAPAVLGLNNARYQRIATHIFADNFMRQLLNLQPDGSLKPPDKTKWLEDLNWPVAFFRRDNPGLNPHDAKTGKDLTINPWTLGFPTMKQNAGGRWVDIPTIKTSSNAFWFTYSGTGPSWVVANDLMVQPFWDRYFFQAAVQPEYDSTVGLIAAYQDNQNYLLFRWTHRDYPGKDDKQRAELVAIMNGRERVLASNARGFDPEQWYTLRLNLSWQHIEVLIDGAPLLSAANPGVVEGRVGLYADGVAHPSKPKVDDATAKMYSVVDKTTHQQFNDAADAMDSAGSIRFNDVKVGDWIGIDNLATSTSYAVKSTGIWQTMGNSITAQSHGTLLTGDKQWSHYRVTTRLLDPSNCSAGLFFQMNAQQNGYLWEITTEGQRLLLVEAGTPGAAVDTSDVRLMPGNWADLRIDVDGPYVCCYCDGQRVLQTYDPARVAGRCGLFSSDGGTQFSMFSVVPLDETLHIVKIHSGFDSDGWMATWSGTEADWYPVVNHKHYLLLPNHSGGPSDPGPAGPLMTNVPGMYWNKGGYYHDLRVTLPLDKVMLDGQALYLSTHYNEALGYRLTLSHVGTQGFAELCRNEKLVQSAPFPLGKTIAQQKTVTLLVVERRGGIVLVTAESVDPLDTFDDPTPLESHLLFSYRDPQPLSCEMIGFKVVNDTLPAARLIVASDRIQDAFEQSPVNWIAQSGIWALMARYSCQPQWNWYGGFGGGTPTLWNKQRLDGDQTVEAYMGIKMQIDGITENEQQRFRDMNVTICADGAHLNSGYSLIRAGRINGVPTTLLLRKGVVVQTSVLAADQISAGGHRQWFAIRLEKRAGEIKVFLDNHLAMTYLDHEPLTGGYTALWSWNNGIMIGRANLSAEKMTLGTPMAAAPLAVQEDLPVRKPQPVLIDGQPVTTLDTFEDGLDGWQPRPGLSAALVRKRMLDPLGHEITYLKIVNVYPAGDMSATMRATPVNLAATPVFTCEYCFDQGTQLNLYLKYHGVWYEFLLTGQEASEMVHTVTHLDATADNVWRHLQVNLGKLLAAKLNKETGTAPTDLTVEQIVLADWSASADLRKYGFGANPGGTSARFRNVGFLSNK